MDVELLYFDGCPHWETADARLREVAAEAGATVRHRRLIGSDAEDLEGFAGSPTILVDGHDPFPTTVAVGGLSCRLYSTPDGPAGSPTVDQLRGVLRGVLRDGNARVPDPGETTSSTRHG